MRTAACAPRGVAAAVADAVRSRHGGALLCSRTLSLAALATPGAHAEGRARIASSTTTLRLRRWMHATAASHAAEMLHIVASAAVPAPSAPSHAAAPAAGVEPFHFDSIVQSEESFASFLAAWTAARSPLHPPAVTDTAAGTARPVCVVAVSGGVDSAMTALLCQVARDAGLYSAVHAVHMRNWDEIEERGVCSGERDARDAARLCASLNLPLEQVDFSREYFNEVFQPLLDEYAAGNTPSPDVLCNRVIKFQLLLDHVRARFGPHTVLATGHYARIKHHHAPSSEQPSTAASNASANSTAASMTAASAEPHLFIAVDPRKDQSYFLSSVPASALRSCVFPLGHFYKTFLKNTLARGEWAAGIMRTRQQQAGGAVTSVAQAEALHAALNGTSDDASPSLSPSSSDSTPTTTTSAAPSRRPASGSSSSSLSRLPASAASSLPPLHALSSKKESMGICFIGKRSLRDFLSGYMELHGGPFVDIEPPHRVLDPDHHAWELWTIGQKASISGLPHKMFVCAKHEHQVRRIDQQDPTTTQTLRVVPMPPPRPPPRLPGSPKPPRDRHRRRHDRDDHHFLYPPPAPAPFTIPLPPYAVFVCQGGQHPALHFDDMIIEAPQWIASHEPTMHLSSSVTSAAAAAAITAADGNVESYSMRVSVKVRSGKQQLPAILSKTRRVATAADDSTEEDLGWTQLGNSPAPSVASSSSSFASSYFSSTAASASSPASNLSAAAWTYRVDFSSPQLSVAPGQSCVLYDESGQRCLGQARIARAGLSYWQKGKPLPDDALNSDRDYV